MKKFISIALLICLAMGLVACTGQADPTVNTQGSISAQPTEASSEPTEAPKSGYVVTVVDTDGNPVAGAMIQMCKLGGDGTCTPGATDEQGKASFNLPQDSYKVSFIVMPPAYTYVDGVQEFYFDGDSMELTITVKKA